MTHLFRQRILPTLIAYLFCLIPVFSGIDYTYILKNVIDLLDSPQRKVAIWVTTFIICGAHYWFITRRRSGKTTLLFKTSNALVNAVLTLSTLGIVVNSSVNLIVGMGKEIQLPGSFFISPNSLDFYSIGAGAFAVLVWCILEYEKMILETFTDKKDVIDSTDERPNLND